jgi:hypothetical protein
LAWSPEKANAFHEVGSGAVSSQLSCN